MTSHLNKTGNQTSPATDFDQTRVTSFPGRNSSMMSLDSRAEILPGGTSITSFSEIVRSPVVSRYKRAIESSMG